MRKIVWGIVILLVLAIAGAALYIMTIDWNQHKERISKQFYDLTGKHISFDGRVSFEVFPTPYLKAINAKVYNSDEVGEKPLLDIKNVMVEMSLMPLLKGEFDVKRMVLDGVIINVDWDKGGINWQGDLSPDQRQMMEDTKMVLNSVSLQNAEVNFEAQEAGISFKLTNLSGEVSAQSIFGPFRIEGNYLKGNTPQGFAITLGKLSESYATTLNAVVTHPKSDSYIRFDGSFHLINRVLNGNVIVETQKLSGFINDNWPSLKMSAEYNEPLALGFDLALNSQNANLSNIVVKYGDTQGAGNIQIPLDDTEVWDITTNFDFADLNLDPLAGFVREFVRKYVEEAYAPDYPINLTADIKAVRSSIDGQGLKNLETSFSFDNDTLSVDNLSVMLPGDTNFKLKGSVYPYNDEVYYQAETTLNATDLMKTLRWLNLEPKANAASVYKKMLLTAKIAGNFDRFQLSPIKVSLDKSTLSGEVGVILGERKDIMLVLTADTINFDNYISSLPEEEKSKTWAQRMAYRFSKLGILNDFDMVLNAKADLVIYESMPFEKVDFKGNILKGKMDIEYCNIEKVANTYVGLKGSVAGFGNIPQMDNLQYDIKSDDVISLINKLELKVPNLDYKKFSKFSINGAINGSSDDFATNMVFDIGSMNASYKGRVHKLNDNLEFDGELDVKHPDLSRLLQNIKAKYEPASSNLGLFRFKSKIVGNDKNMDFSNLNVNVGYTALSGSASYEDSGERPSIIGNFKVNKLELDKYLAKAKTDFQIRGEEAPALVSFLDKPFWATNKIDYSPYIGINMKADVKVDELSVGRHLFKDADFGVSLVNGVVEIGSFAAVYKNTPMTGALTLHMIGEPSISANVNMPEANMADFSIGGKTYNLKGGKFSTRFDFNSKADSLKSFVSSLKGKGEFKATTTEVGGINLQAIYDDLIKREKKDGLSEFVKNNVESGKTLIDKLSGRVIVDSGNYSLADVSLGNVNSEIKAYGEGNIDDWTMNVVFNVKYNEPKYLPEFSFSLKNGMDNPNVDVNVSSLFKMYQAKEEQREAAKEAEIEAEKNYWTNLYDEQKKIADDLVKSTRNNLEKEIESKEQIAFSEDSVNKYNLLKQELAAILAALVETFNSVDIVKIDNEVINKLKGANNIALQEIEICTGKVSEIYLNDLKKQGEAEYNRVVDIHNQFKQDVFMFNSLNDKYRERLASIITTYSLDTDPEVSLLKEQIDSKIEKLENINNDVEKHQKLVMGEDADAKIYEQRNQDLNFSYEQIKNGRDILKQDIDIFKKMVDSKILAAEEEYNTKIEDEENRRRVEENTGSISIKKTGKTLTVVRDLEEIKNAEQEISSEEVRVLDFSREKLNIQKQEEASNENVIKKGRIIRAN